jgi:hypothetical protein
MKKSDFEGLMKGMKEADSFIRTGELNGGKIHIPAEIDAAAIRAKTGHRSGFPSPRYATGNRAAACQMVRPKCYCGC